MCLRLCSYFFVVFNLSRGIHKTCHVMLGIIKDSVEEDCDLICIQRLMTIITIHLANSSKISDKGKLKKIGERQNRWNKIRVKIGDIDPIRVETFNGRS